VVERKGIGHPDTIADMVAEDFTNAYSKYTLSEFGEIINHSSDKVLLSGGMSELHFGSMKTIKPMTAYLFGKTVNTFGQKEIPVEKIFKDSCKKVFTEVFKNEKVLDALEYKVDTNNGIGMEHSKTFYAPKEKDDMVVHESYKSNDTIICSGFAPYSEIETLAIDIENYVNGEEWKRTFSFTGFDIKVMIVKLLENIDITLCVPFIAERTPSFSFYEEQKKHIHESVQAFVDSRVYKEKGNTYTVHINTRDFDEHAYVVAFGSALDKGDFGAVGRGNKYSGVISLCRKTNIEAPAGKNPQLHSGKLFTIFAHHLAWKLHKKYTCPISVDIAAKAGEDIDDPFVVIVNREDGNLFSETEQKEISNFVVNEAKNIKKYKEVLPYQDSVSEHHQRTFIYD
jgi:S-adenosylmethionine synthetase